MDTKFQMMSALEKECEQAREDEALLLDVWLAMGAYSEGITPEQGKQYRLNDRLRKRFNFDDSE